MKKQLALGAVGAILVALAAFFLGLRMNFHPEDQKPGKFPEQLVYVRTADDVVDAGVLFTSPSSPLKPLAIIWVHGWGANFYTPSYIGIGRELAERGFATVSVNTRMHDLGNVEKYTLLGKRVRGGGYWGVTSEDARDIAAWIDYAQQLGYSRVILVGHSAGWASVARYEADSQDRRVAGLVFASPCVGCLPKPDDPQVLAQAKKLVDEGKGDDLIRLPHHSYPSFISAATQLDTDNTPRQYKDFFGTQTPDAAITKVTCPVLAFYGSKDDIGGEKDLALLTSSVRRLAHGPASVDTAMIANGNHEYVGEEAQVAQVIARWIETEVAGH
ncbi:MAG TPA: alpha/beta fold hydrolase [Terriglobales bacterium]|jgi:pimeloyl-ACP methyl ester carboxylesterase|nr:alpha/beta fold hydrolase [Terriglobales bacterium]